MEKLRNLSLRKTILLYTAISLTCTFLISVFIIKSAEKVQDSIWLRYVDIEKHIEATANEDGNYEVDVPRPNLYEMTQTDYMISEFCDFLETYTILILSIMGSCVAILLFYKNKLKNPMMELEQASKNIGENNLDFKITYENKDEMGHLCNEFERMRAQLERNNQKVWRMIEEERTLKAAIVHDIRSPLSVLKGYQEMLIEYLPDETIDIDKALEMLTASMGQIDRMEVFLETMQKVSSLEKRELVSNKITATKLKDGLQSELKILEKTTTKQCVLKVSSTNEVFYGDQEVILEVTENLLSNAIRYAKREVDIHVQLSALELKISVSDDGNGFGESVAHVTKAFYQQNMKDSLKHAGLGMYISRLYCEKHGGHLLVEDNMDQGAVVIAVFHRIV